MSLKLHKLILITLAICFQLAITQVPTKTPSPTAPKTTTVPTKAQPVPAKPKTKVTENSLFKRENLAVPTPHCLLAPVFGFKTSKIRLVKPTELKFCKNLSQTCCSQESFNQLSARWENHNKSQGRLIWTNIRIHRLLLKLQDN